MIFYVFSSTEFFIPELIEQRVKDYNAGKYKLVLSNIYIYTLPLDVLVIVNVILTTYFNACCSISHCNLGVKNIEVSQKPQSRTKQLLFR